jgi:hypothetical protein
MCEKFTTDNEMTLADHAESWMKENGYKIPSRESTEWKNLYEKWIDYAFSDFS